MLFDEWDRQRRSRYSPAQWPPVQGGDGGDRDEKRFITAVVYGQT